MSDPIQALIEKCEGAYAPKTLSCYHRDLIEFRHFCEARGLEWYPADGETVALWIDEACGHFVKTTVRRKMGAVRFLHVMNNHPNPTTTAEVKLAYRRVMRKNRRQPKRAAPITPAMLERLLDTCGDDLEGPRDRALMLVAHESLARSGEIVAIQVEDVFLDEDPARLLIPRSKADIEGLGRWADLSPVAAGAVRDWVAAAGLNGGALFRRVRGSYVGAEGLNVSSILRMLRRRQGMIYSEGRPLSGHSFRVGGAQKLLAEGKSELEIMLAGGWLSAGAMAGYLR
jgi:integrase/recombinase XerD